VQDATANGPNDDRQLAGKQEKVGRRTERQTDCRGIGGQPAVEMVMDSRRENKRGQADGQTDRRTYGRNGDGQSVDRRTGGGIG